jgi:hypothetical protein
MDDKKKMEEISKSFNQIMKHLENEQEKFWNSLSKEDQLKAFCAVSRRIFEGEIENSGTYRYILYHVFGFGSESYTQAQMAGYLSIHNLIAAGRKNSEVHSIDE